MPRKNLITIDDFEPVVGEFKKLHSYAETVKLHLNKNELKNNLKWVKENHDESIQVVLFDTPGSGKSSIINFFITGSLNGPLPKSAAMGPGCTKKPIRCSFDNSKNYTVYLQHYKIKELSKYLF
jgi:ribosome biogenesis GTPase A